MENERKIAWARYVEIMYEKYHQEREKEDLYWTDGYGN